MAHSSLLITRIQTARKQIVEFSERSAGGATDDHPLVGLFHTDDDSIDALAYAEVLTSAEPGAGQDDIADLLLSALAEVGLDPSSLGLEGIARGLAREITEADVTLTGAETVALLLEQAGTRAVFAYAGTSELALCDSCDRAAGIRLMNGRGDKESAFMAAGASLLSPNLAAAILHGARGLTNAAGAVADARRNEAGTVFIVGLPSTGSAPFLPPHGEAGLMSAIGTFADWWWEAPAVPEEGAARERAAYTFVSKLSEALAGSACMPTRPAMFGVPQDVAEGRWVSLDAVRAVQRPQAQWRADEAVLDQALVILRSARRPLFLVDDYGTCQVK